MTHYPKFFLNKGKILQFKVQISGILEEKDSFYWPKMHSWKCDKKFGQGPFNRKSSCQELYCLDNYYRRRMPKEKIRTLLHHHRHSKVDRRCRTCFIEIKMHYFQEECMVVRILWQQHYWKNSWWLGHHWSPRWRKVNYVHSQSWKPHLTASQSTGSFKQGQLKMIS